MTKNLFFFLFSKSAKSRGQAVVEYVLILSVVVMVIGALVLKLNQGLERWAKSITGEDGHIACLMQTGKLPGQYQDCNNTLLSQMDLDLNLPGESAGGASGSGTSGGGGAGGGSSSGDQSPASGDGTSSADKNTDSTQISDHNSGNSRQRGKSGRKKGARGSSPQGDLISLNNNNASKGIFGEDEENSEGGGGGGGGGRRKKKDRGFKDGFGSGGKPGYKGQRFRAVQSYGKFAGAGGKEQRRKVLLTASAGPVKKSQLTGGDKTSYLMKKKLKKKTKEVKIGKWSFGNIFRIILIICVIATVALLIGGQVTQVKKSMK